MDTKPLSDLVHTGMTFGRIASRNSDLHADRVAFVEGDRSVTYGEFDALARCLANALAARGVRRGDRICIMAENSIEYMAVVYGAAKLGVVVAALNFRLTANELAACLEVAEPKLAVVAPDFAERFGSAMRQGRSVEAIWWLDGPPHDGSWVASTVQQEDLVDLIAGGDPSRVSTETEVDARDPFTLLFTSGSTGRPKGVAISHGAIVARAMVVAAELGLHGGHSFIAWAPMFHAGCLDYVLSTGVLAGRVVVFPRFDVRAVANCLETEDVGWLLMMPGTIEPLVEELRVRPRTIRGVQVAGCMADLLPPEDIARLTQSLDAPFLNSFGSTEAGLVPCVCTVLSAPGERPQSLAKEQSSFCDVRLVDDAGEEVARGEPGELLLRGPTLFSGYWNDPVATAEALEGSWFHTGDMLVRNLDGSLDFVDRKKYLIKSGGENIYPAEVERALLSHADVVEAAVVRAPSARWGETPVAFVATRASAVTPEALLDHCRAVGLAKYKLPRAVTFIREDEFPRNVTGKVVRQDLEETAIRVLADVNVS